MPAQQMLFPAEKNQILYPFCHESKQIFIFPDKHDIYVFLLAFACVSAIISTIMQNTGQKELYSVYLVGLMRKKLSISSVFSSDFPKTPSVFEIVLNLSLSGLRLTFR